MKPLFPLSLLLAITMATVAAFGDERATVEEAKAMALNAAELARQSPTQAIAEFNTNPKWRDRDLYVVSFDKDVVISANAALPAMVGKSMKDLKDVDGKPFTQEMRAVKDQGWVEYKWKNPSNGMVEQKASYVVRVSDDLFVLVGAYKK